MWKVWEGCCTGSGYMSTIFTSISATALIKFFAPQVRCLFESSAYLRAVLSQGRCLFEGGPYSRAALIRGRRLFEGGAYSRAALIRGRRLFKHCNRQFYFFYIFIQRYNFCLLIFLCTDTKLIINLELGEKFRLWKKTKSFMTTRAKISEVRASAVRHLFEGSDC